MDRQGAISVLAVILLMAVGYNILGSETPAWDRFYFFSRDLSIFLLLYITLQKNRGIVYTGMAYFMCIFFLLSAIISLFYDPGYWALLLTITSILAYAIIGRTVFTKKLKSNYYNEVDSFIVIRKPLYLTESLRAFIMLDGIGSVKVVNSGIETGFKIKQQNVNAYTSKHNYDSRNIYILTDKNIRMKNKQYHILKNNCINCWDVNIKKEIK
jgi:hypothetical protein